MDKVQSIVGGVPLWQFILILIAPALIAMTLTVIIVRYLHAIHIQENHHKFTIRQAAKHALYIGAFFGPLCQWGFQETISWFTGSPLDARLVIIAPAITGVASMLWYEILKWLLWWRYTSTRQKVYRNIYNWLNVKTFIDNTGVEHLDTSDLNGEITQRNESNNDT